MANVRDMGSPAVLGTKNITANGTYNASSDNLDGFSQVSVEVPQATLGTKSITQNGTYNASADNLDGFSQVSVEVPQATLGTKSITQNGTYNASADNLDGFSQVVVNVATGVPLMSRADWDNLTDEEKQSYGLIAIQDAVSGFERGVLVNGADYVHVGKYIPYSDEDTVICEAYVDNFVADALSWGVGSNPITFNSAPTKDTSENAIDIKVATSGKLAYCDLGAVDTVFTAYVVLKLISPTQYARIISALKYRSSGNGILLYGNPVVISSWGNDTFTSQDSTTYFACAIQYAGSGSAKGGILNNIVTKSVYGAGRYITLGRSDTDPDTYNAVPCDIMVKYCGITNVADSETVINNNLSNLISQFIS